MLVETNPRTSLYRVVIGCDVLAASPKPLKHLSHPFPSGGIVSFLSSSRYLEPTYRYYMELHRHIIVIVLNVNCHGFVIDLSSLSTIVGRGESTILQEIAQPIKHTQCSMQ